MRLRTVLLGSHLSQQEVLCLEQRCHSHHTTKIHSATSRIVARHASDLVVRVCRALQTNESPAMIWPISIAALAGLDSLALSTIFHSRTYSCQSFGYSTCHSLNPIGLRYSTQTLPPFFTNKHSTDSDQIWVPGTTTTPPMVVHQAAVLHPEPPKTLLALARAVLPQDLLLRSASDNQRHQTTCAIRFHRPHQHHR